MEYRRLGSAGLKISALSLGSWTTFGESLKDKKVAQEIITKAYDSGINFFDMADAYARGESERMMGEALKDFPRHTLVLSSKLFRPMSDDINDRGLSRKHIMESIDKSLLRIGTDYVDMYYCHRDDPETPIEETVRAMDDLIHAGKVLYWGTSEWPAAKIKEAWDIADKYNLYKPQVEQSLYNLFYRERVEKEIFPISDSSGIGIVVWSPLASGLLTGKYDSGLPEGSRLERLDFLRETWYQEEFIDRVRRLRPIAEDLGISRSQLALAWILQHPRMNGVITGATKLSQLESNLEALNVKLTEDVVAMVEDIFPWGLITKSF